VEKRVYKLENVPRIIKIVSAGEGMAGCPRQRLRSSTTNSLSVPAVRLSTIVGHRAFPVAGARVWNDLPSATTTVCADI